MKSANLQPRRGSMLKARHGRARQPMTFAKTIFWLAGIWGLLTLTPLFFMFEVIGRNDPPPHHAPRLLLRIPQRRPGLAIGAFFVIARDPVRFRPMMIPFRHIEKFGYGASLTALYLQHRLHPSDLMFAGIDTLFGILFMVAYSRTAASYGNRR